jgi:hypothetical protein
METTKKQRAFYNLNTKVLFAVWQQATCAQGAALIRLEAKRLNQLGVSLPTKGILGSGGTRALNFEQRDLRDLLAVEYSQSHGLAGQFC